ncbi:simple sugar transport system ATP-binding protein [Azospirillum lipoferum]|uniref:ABC transporter ATP-binding protein n=1 Tax=Azospirillum lipoferum TaxID=193 RepID=A0A5A9GP33_AZOLI|nr:MULTISPECIES: ABC transporter ATP-binding protein [Azospirillum]KAA0595364.1 ABC transporter ATP-binding protein [Azospirillum lipoferum]MCP1611743.1 simple sugar transport system ATP-binding protein [Azospirillum lipoferum]MDW5533499.1 ABC transporter ATP-binding protein [Azospirillum sp. NL1]
MNVMSRIVPQPIIPLGPADGAPAPGLEAVAITKRFGAFTALDAVSLKLRPGTVHALLGENGAGKSTLVKCIMGFYRPDEGAVVVGDREVVIGDPRAAQTHGLGMVYQHFTLVPRMTVLENLVMARASVPAVIDWRAERRRLAAFLDTMPFTVDVDAPVATLAAGDKQKAEIVKQLYLDARVLILDEPTSVLTPDEADEMLGLIRGMALAGRLSVLIITHKFREVMAFADDVTVLRRGRLAGSGAVADHTPDSLARLMIGDSSTAVPVERRGPPGTAARLRIAGLRADDDGGLPALHGVDLTVRMGEIVGVAGVSGNGQVELVQVLAGQRAATAGSVSIGDEPYRATREEMRRHKVHCLPEEPLRNACVPGMSVAENMAFRSFDEPPIARGRWWLDPAAMRRAALDLIARYRVKTTGPDAPIATLSGGNVQRAVLARELSREVDVLIAANPVFGLDFAAVADIHAQIVEARNRGTAVLLVSEDLDELLELSDRLVVMSHGAIVHETTPAAADLTVIGRCMAGH